MRLEAEYPYAERHVRDNRASADVAMRRPPSQKVKVSALKAVIAERNVKLEVIEGKLKALMRGPWYKALSQEESDWMGTIKVNDELIDNYIALQHDNPVQMYLLTLVRSSRFSLMTFA